MNTTTCLCGDPTQLDTVHISEPDTAHSMCWKPITLTRRSVPVPPRYDDPIDRTVGHMFTEILQDIAELRRRLDEIDRREVGDTRIIIDFDGFSGCLRTPRIQNVVSRISHRFEVDGNLPPFEFFDGAGHVILIGRSLEHIKRWLVEEQTGVPPLVAKQVK